MQKISQTDASGIEPRAAGQLRGLETDPASPSCVKPWLLYLKVIQSKEGAPSSALGPVKPAAAPGPLSNRHTCLSLSFLDQL